MSQTIDYPDDTYWDRYSAWCAKNDTNPTVADYVDWCGEQGLSV